MAKSAQAAHAGDEEWNTRDEADLTTQQRTFVEAVRASDVEVWHQALIALARRRCDVLFAMLRDGTLYSPPAAEAFTHWEGLMKPLTYQLRIVTTILSVLCVVLILHPRYASSQQLPATDLAMPRHEHAAGTNEQHPHQSMQMHDQQSQRETVTPTMPGQDAFGAIQEIVWLLEADPKTDWSKIDLEALRQHLIDMNAVTLKANAVAKPIDGGLEIAITGAGRTLAAIRRMLPAHAHELNRMSGWSATTAILPNGVRLTVTSADPKQVQRIRGLGFIGLLVSGSHHQPHHLAMAKGEFAHQH